MSDNANTVQKIKELRVDSLYGKKKHYNAADRYSRKNLYYGVPAVIINILVSSVVIAFLSDSFPDFGKWVVSTLSLIAALCVGLQTFFNYPKLSEGHRNIATRYLSVAKQCSRLIAYFNDGNMNPDNLREQLEVLAKEYDEIIKSAESFPTSKLDYEMARQGFKEEETYLDKELDFRGE